MAFLVSGKSHFCTHTLTYTLSLVTVIWFKNEYLIMLAHRNTLYFTPISATLSLSLVIMVGFSPRTMITPFSLFPRFRSAYEREDSPSFEHFTRRIWSVFIAASFAPQSYTLRGWEANRTTLYELWLTL